MSLAIDRETFNAQFARTPFLVPHGLARHRLFTLACLVELSKRLPASQVEYNPGEVPVGLDPARTPRNGLTPEETIRRIAECRSWLVLKHVELDRRYRRLLDLCLADVRNASPGLTAGLCDPHAFIFVSSPNAVTPYHLDPEENFLLQIRGTKTISVFDRADRVVVSEAEIERFLTGAHRNLAWRDEFQRRAHGFALTPGQAIHVPFAAPHWVQNGPEVSISFSVTFNTRASMRRTHAHRLNARLRQWGVAPVPVGRSALRDGVKQLLSRASAWPEKLRARLRPWAMRRRPAYRG